MKKLTEYVLGRVIAGVLVVADLPGCFAPFERNEIIDRIAAAGRTPAAEVASRR